MPKPAKLADGKWNVLERIGQGGFAEVYRGCCTEAQAHVAIKFEENNRRSCPQQLENEVKCLKALWNHPTLPQGFVQLFYFGSEPTYDFAVIELLGKSLGELLSAAKGTFSTKTTSLIAGQGLQRLEYLHSKGIVHRDIKPENFMMGIGNKLHHVYLIDFGLSQSYHLEGGGHCPMKTELGLTGNARYASLNNHRGLQQSRRDDLEAFGHMLFQFLLGQLPWTGLSARTTAEKYRKIHEKKEATPIGDLCKGFPDCFGLYLSACRSLSFTQCPDYPQLRKLFVNICEIDCEGGTTLCDHRLEWLQNTQMSQDLAPLVALDVKQPDDASIQLGADSDVQMQDTMCDAESTRTSSTRDRGESSLSLNLSDTAE